MLQASYGLRRMYSSRPYRCQYECNSLAIYDGLSITDAKLVEKKYNEYFNLVSSSNQISLLQKTYRRGNNYDGFRVKYIFVRETEGENYITELCFLHADVQ